MAHVDEPRPTRQAYVSLDRVRYVHDILDTELVLNTNTLFQNTVDEPITTSLKELLTILNTKLTNNGISMKKIELIGSTVRSILFDAKESIDAFDIDLAIIIDSDRFDDVLHAEEQTIQQLSHQDLVVWSDINNCTAHW